MGFAGLLRALASGLEAGVSAANEEAARFFIYYFFYAYRQPNGAPPMKRPRVGSLCPSIFAVQSATI